MKSQPFSSHEGGEKYQNLPFGAKQHTIIEMEFASEKRLDLIQATCNAILALLIQENKEIQTMASGQNALDTQIAQLTSEVVAQTSVVTSVQTFISGIPALIATAVANAQAAGATPAELASLTALGASIQNNSAALTAAVTANTAVSPDQAAAVKST
jgi:hypothetical protein